MRRQDRRSEYRTRQQQWIHLRLTAQYASGDRQGKFDDFLLDSVQVAITLLAEGFNQLCNLAQLTLFGGLLHRGMASRSV